MAYIAASDKKRGVPGVVAKGRSVAPEVKDIRKALATAIDNHADLIQAWLAEIYDQEGAKSALQSLESLMEYYVPKLSRVEHRGEQVSEVIIKWGGTE